MTKAELASEGVGCPGQEFGTVLKAVWLMMEVNSGNDLDGNRTWGPRRPGE